MELNTEIELNVQEHVDECEDKKKKKRKLVCLKEKLFLFREESNENFSKVRRRKKKDPNAEEEEDEDELDDDAAQLAAFEATKVDVREYFFENPMSLKYFKRSQPHERVNFFLHESCS